jgi:chemotaxis protein histidine kinase CheA
MHWLSRRLGAGLLFALITIVSPPASAQLPPFGPISPSKPEECARFAQDVQQFSTDMRQQHEECLAKFKADRQEPPGSLLCSRSACQNLHDYVYGDWSKQAQKDIDSCYAQVAEKQARQKQEEEERQKREAALKNEERKLQAAQQETQRKREAAREQQRKQREQDEARQKQESEAEAKRQAALGQQVQEAEEAERRKAAKQAAAEQDEKIRASREALDMMADPFGGQKTSERHDDALAIVNPFPSAAKDQFGNTDSQHQDKLNPPAPTIAAVSQSIAEYMQSSKDAWQSLRGEQRLTEPLKLAFDGLSMAKTAAGGEVPTTIPMVEKLADFVRKEGTVLDMLAKESTEDLLKNSGLNSFDRSTIPAAQTYLDNLSMRLATIQRLNQQLVPSIKAAQTVLENPLINTARMTVANSTLPGLDPIALGDIIAQLNGCASQIDVIQKKLRLARSVVY